MSYIPMGSVSLAEALNTMTDELKTIDPQLSNQFNIYKNNIITLEQKVKADQATFNSSRRQPITSDTEAVGGNYYGRQYTRTVGGNLGNTSIENRFAYQNGISRYI